MTFGKAKPQPFGGLDLSGHAPLLGGAQEFLRMWNRPGGEVTCFIDPTKLGADPALFGIALMDCVRHGAKSWARATGVSESEALGRVLAGFDAERGAPTDLPRAPTPEGDVH